MHIRTHMHTHAHMHCTRTHMHTHAHAHTHMHMHTHTHTHMHTHIIHMHTHTHIMHMHTHTHVMNQNRGNLLCPQILGSYANGGTVYCAIYILSHSLNKVVWHNLNANAVFHLFHGTAKDV